MAAKRTAGKQKNARKKALFRTVLTAVGIVLLSAALFLFLNDSYFHIRGVPTAAQFMNAIGMGVNPDIKLNGREVAVHFIDVGQGDCSLIEAPECNILIDCGEEDRADTVLRYLEFNDIDELDYVIATHPHSDHIGGMYRILSEMKVGTLIMPELPENMIPLSTEYSRMLDAVEENGIPASYAKPYDKISLGNGIQLRILAPLHDDYETLNNYSVVTRLIDGVNSFLFTADIERAAENDILNSGEFVDSNVIKIAHHGSTSSSMPSFLSAVAPEYAVISVGKDNAYGHPSQTVLDRLTDLDCSIYTTAESGNIVFVSDGLSIKVYTEQGEESEAA